ncbi:MAG: class I SAM-dependent methyltransferase [Nitrospirae bacterium]|nr:class I SAM-dependent methyltransferase [Nitrospirota bacterium]
MAHVHTEAPSPLLADHIGLLKTAPGRAALDVACGKGRNSIFLARNGFTVTGIELNGDAIAATRAQAAALGLPVTVEQTDLETGTATLPMLGFDVVCVFYYLHRPLLKAMRDAVKPGGFMIYETFLIDQHERWGSPRRAEFAFGHNELLDAFMGFRIHHYKEVVDAAKQSAIAQIIAQRA